MAQTITLSRYTIGSDAYQSIPTACQTLGTRIQPIGGKKALAAALPLLTKSLSNSALSLCDALWYGGECSLENIDFLCLQCKKSMPEIILGIGGGKAIDAAKSVANRLHLPVLTLPTIASTCAGVTALSVVYHAEGNFSHFDYFDAPPLHCFINTMIIANAPVQYLRAGMGDAIAKHYESFLSSRNDQLLHHNALAKEISRTCVSHLFTYGKDALESAKHQIESEALQQSILAIIISTGFVSTLIDDDYNGALAHSIFYGLTLLPHIEENYLHGDVVSYGVLVQLMLDGQTQQCMEVYQILQQWGCPTCLSALNVSCTREALTTVLDETVAGPDMKHLPYPITQDMIFKAMQQVEALNA